jgi:cell division protein FtsB
MSEMKKHHQDTLRNYDMRIAIAEAKVKELHEGRREYINRHNLNDKLPAGKPRG